MNERTVTWTITATWRVPIPEGLTQHWIKDKVHELWEQTPNMLGCKPKFYWSIKQEDFRRYRWDTEYRP